MLLALQVVVIEVVVVVVNVAVKVVYRSSVHIMPVSDMIFPFKYFLKVST